MTSTLLLGEDICFIPNRTVPCHHDLPQPLSDYIGRGQTLVCQRKRIAFANALLAGLSVVQWC